MEITKAHRSPAGTDGLNEAALKADRGADVVGFRFNQPFNVNGQSRTLADYDMALFFAINPGKPEYRASSRGRSNRAVHGSRRRLLRNRGSCQSRFGAVRSDPRVRSMRRWWSSAGPNGEPSAPPPVGNQRHDTTRSGPDNVTNFEDQSDDMAQEIKPLLYGAGFAVKARLSRAEVFPHPLLCSPEGRVTWLPDHMHEGWCEVPGQLATRTFTINGHEQARVSGLHAF